MEYQDFNKRWDDALAQMEAQDQQAIRALEERHIRDLEENRLPLTFKLSAELLNLKTIQGQLARQKQYAEAHQVQIKAQQMEDEERERYMQQRHKKIVAAEATLI